jgi:hypothetical protein
MPRVERFEGGQVAMGIRLPRGLYDELQDRAIVSGVPIAEQFRRALRFWFDSYPVRAQQPRKAKLVSLKPSHSKTAKRKR